jgi:hypothetical protein
LITSIIFSKNRPLQLDLCLSSINRNFSDSTQNIVIHNNSSEFSEAHGLLESEHPNVAFWPQSDSLFKDVLIAVESSENDYICFFTDDDIVYSPFACVDYSFLEDPTISCLSLRMGENITERSHGGEVGLDVCKKRFWISNEMMAWPKTFHGYGSYWSYDLSVDGHIFRKKDICQIMDELCYLEARYQWNQTPNELEASLQRFWTLAPNLIVSPPQSVVVNSPNNRVQQSHAHNRSGDLHDYDENYLLGKYMAGNRINIDYLNFNDIKCPHTEINLMEGLK